MTEAKIKKIIDNLVIVVDAQEKDRFIIETFDKYNIKHIRESLKSADFSAYVPPIPELEFEGIDFRNELLIERKNSWTEISQNLTKHKTRFHNEFSRTDARIIVMIEDSYKNGAHGEYKSDITPKSLLGMAHSWEFKYDTNIVYIDKEVAPLYIYNTFKYFLRYKLKSLKIN